MKRCIISHEVPHGGGRFTVFRSGLDYPDSEATGREKYFEESPPTEADLIDWEVETNAT